MLEKAVDVNRWLENKKTLIEFQWNPLMFMGVEEDHNEDLVGVLTIQRLKIDQQSN